MRKFVPDVTVGNKIRDQFGVEITVEVIHHAPGTREDETDMYMFIGTGRSGHPNSLVVAYAAEDVELLA